MESKYVKELSNFWSICQREKAAVPDSNPFKAKLNSDISDQDLLKYIKCIFEEELADEDIKRRWDVGCILLAEYICKEIGIELFSHLGKIDTAENQEPSLDKEDVRGAEVIVEALASLTEALEEREEQIDVQFDGLKTPSILELYKVIEKGVAKKRTKRDVLNDEHKFVLYLQNLFGWLQGMFELIEGKPVAIFIITEEMDEFFQSKDGEYH